MEHEQNRSMFRCVVVGVGVCLFLFLTGTISANEPCVHSESYGQERISLLTASFMEEHSGKLKHLLWIVPLILIMVGYSYLKRSCPECGKGWGLRYTGNTENRVNKWVSWLIKNEYDEYRCKHCGHEEWMRSDKE